MHPHLTPLALTAIVFYMTTATAPQTTTGYLYTDEERAAMQAALKHTVFTFKGRDKYRRSYTDIKVGNRTVVRITAMPKAYRDAGNGSHQVSDWTVRYGDPADRSVTAYGLKAARAAAAAIVDDAVTAAKAGNPIGTIN